MRKTGATVLILMLIGLISIIAYNLYYMYKNIDIQNSNYKTEKIAVSTENVENVESVNDNLLIEDVLENTIQSVVGISRLKSSDGSILKNVSSEDLGLGTGVIVSENGYILSNSHVTGDRFSVCYVTIEENTYKHSSINIITAFLKTCLLIFCYICKLYRVAQKQDFS